MIKGNVSAQETPFLGTKDNRDFLCELDIVDIKWTFNEHWTKRWNWSSCTKLALRAT